MKKLVNGVLVDMAQDEAQHLAAEQAEWSQKAPEVTAQQARESAIDALIKDRARQPNAPAEVLTAAALID